jgi:hypothetical protein
MGLLNLSRLTKRQRGLPHIATELAENLGGVLSARVKVTELLVAKGGRAAKDAIGFAMAAGGTGHKTSK